MREKVPSLIANQAYFIASKEQILKQWLSYNSAKKILDIHDIDKDYFIQKYASGVFDYFMGVIAGEVAIGDCPVMQELLEYLKFREISADELFEICSNFRRSMVDFSYDANLNTKELFEEISYIFDKNFSGILKYYTDTIFQKLIDARQEALQAGQAKEYFLSNMSHEIRTPLNAILGFVNLLINEDMSKKHKKYLGIILNSGENLLSIINDILDFSKLRSGEFTVEAKSFSLHDELNHILELFVASANSKKITISSFIDPSIPKELYGDSLRIKQIFANFLSNAIKFTADGGLIDVEAKCHDKVLKISVKDSGIGIAKEDMKTIFSAFMQGQTSEHSAGGTGLGLSISSQLAELMGGKVSVSSIQGEGSIFYVEVPIEIHNKNCLTFDDIEDFQKLKMFVYAKDGQPTFRQKSFLRYAEFFKMNIVLSDKIDSEDFDIGIYAHEECDDEFIKSVIKSNKMFIALMNHESNFYDEYSHINYLCFPLYCSKIHTGFTELIKPEVLVPQSKKVSQKFSGHILIAEDNEANQELIKILLQKYGLSYDLAKNGLEAFNLYKTKKYDLILMDEQMPVMNGNEAIKKISEYEKENNILHTPVSAVTANVIKGVKEKGLLNGYDAFLGKPIILKDLEYVFRSFLKQDEQSEDIVEEVQNIAKIEGLDVKKLQKELMLDVDELTMLLRLFIKKMKTTIPDLENAIRVKEYKKIALLAHNIKGSSGNFRIESIQKNASEMESMAKQEEPSYAYEAVCEIISQKIQSIKIL